MLGVKSGRLKFHFKIPPPLLDVLGLWRKYFTVYLILICFATVSEVGGNLLGVLEAWTRQHVQYLLQNERSSIFKLRMKQGCILNLKFIFLAPFLIHIFAPTEIYHKEGVRAAGEFFFILFSIFYILSQLGKNRKIYTPGMK